MEFIFGAKPGDHKYMFDWIEDYGLSIHRKKDDKGRDFVYSWTNDVTLGSREDAYSRHSAG